MASLHQNHVSNLVFALLFRLICCAHLPTNAYRSSRWVHAKNRKALLRVEDPLEIFRDLGMRVNPRKQVEAALGVRELGKGNEV